MSTVPKVEPIRGRDGERGLPADPDAERFILASIFLDEGKFAEVRDLEPDDFLTEAHRLIFACMRDLCSDGEPVDTVTAASELRRRKQLDAVGGLSYLVSLTDGMPNVSRTESWARIVKEKARLRRLIFASQKVVNQALLDADPLSEIIEAHRAVIDELGRTANRRGVRLLADLPPVSQSESPEFEYIRVPELVKPSFVGLTGESGCGKSHLAADYARSALQAGIPVLVLDGENPRNVVEERNQRLGIKDSPLYRHWGGWCDDGPPQPNDPRVTTWAREREQKPLIIIDNLAHFLSADENDAQAMRAFMNRGRHLVDLGATVVVLHNSGKSDTSNFYRGSSDFKAALDAAFHVTNYGENDRLGRLTLRCFKSRFGFGGSLVYQYANGRFVRCDHDEPTQTVSEQMTALLRLNPGVKVARLTELARTRGISRDQVRDFIGTGLVAKVVRFESGRNNEKRYFLNVEN